MLHRQGLACGGVPDRQEIKRSAEILFVGRAFQARHRAGSERPGLHEIDLIPPVLLISCGSVTVTPLTITPRVPGAGSGGTIGLSLTTERHRLRRCPR